MGPVYLKRSEELHLNTQRMFLDQVYFSFLFYFMWRVGGTPPVFVLSDPMSRWSQGSKEQEQPEQRGEPHVSVAAAAAAPDVQQQLQTLQTELARLQAAPDVQQQLQTLQTELARLQVGRGQLQTVCEQAQNRIGQLETVCEQAHDQFQLICDQHTQQIGELQAELAEVRTQLNKATMGANGQADQILGAKGHGFYGGIYGVSGASSSTPYPGASFPVDEDRGADPTNCEEWFTTPEIIRKRWDPITLSPWCKVCKNWVDDGHGHITSIKHQNNVAEFQKQKAYHGY